jgi:Family of unknown function (DUF6049)
VSTRWATTALCTLAVAAAALLGAAGAGAATSARPAGGPPLTLVSQTPWITPVQPWFNLALGIGPAAGPASGLHVSLTFYARLDDSSQLQQAIGGSPPTTPLLRLADVPVGSVGPTGTLTASACVTVLPNADASPPASGPDACPAGGPTLTLGCTPLTGRCGDVYPVAVALLRQGSTTPLARFTTFLTYQEPGAIGEGGPLRVGVLVPVTAGSAPLLADALSEHRDVATTLAVSPVAVNAIERTHWRDGLHALDQLATLSGAQVLDQSFVPINVAALSEAGIAGEIAAQVGRGDTVLRDAGFKVSGGPWVDTVSSFAQGDAADLGAGLQVAGSSQLVLSNGDLGAGGLSNYTFAQPFTLDLGHGSNLAAAAADSALSNRFTAQPADPVLGAEQLLAALDFIHFENAFLRDPRGVVVDPPAGWRPSGTFLTTLLAGLSGNPALSAVTLSQLFTQVPIGGNREPAVRQLQAGPADPGISHSSADRIALGRQQLSSYTEAVDLALASLHTTGHPPELTTLNDALLATEARGLDAARRTAALSAFDKAFAGQTDRITLATERTVTFTAQRAAIPVTVLSDAPYPVRVVVTLASDKFSFPNGSSRQLLLDRPTTSVRVTAQARTSGDRLPIEVTLHTPDGQLVLAHTVLTVQSTAISFVGVALTVLAGAVLLVWWVRTWRRSRLARARRRAD